MSKRAKWQLVKQNLCYTVDEASRLLGVGKATVRWWIKHGGLQIINDQKPFLIRGIDLKVFLQNRRKPTRKCELDQCWCFTCKKPQKVAFGEVEITQSNNVTEMMTGLCQVCTGTIYKRISRIQIQQIQAILKVTFIQAPQPMNDSGDPR